VNSVRSPAYQAGMDARFAMAARHSRWCGCCASRSRSCDPGDDRHRLVSRLNPFRISCPSCARCGKLVVSGTKITMESPHFVRYSTDQRPYELWRNRDPGSDRSDHVDLRSYGPRLMEDKTTSRSTPHGLFDSKQQLLDLHKRSSCNPRRL